MNPAANHCWEPDVLGNLVNSPFTERFLSTAYSCLEVSATARKPKDEPRANFSAPAWAHLPLRSPGPVCVQKLTCAIPEILFYCSFPLQLPPPLPPPLSLLWNPSPRCDFLCFLWLGICRFPITQSGCLLEKPKNSNFLGRHLIKFPTREQESPPL